MAFCKLYYWDKGQFGHTGLAIETTSGKKVYISLLRNSDGTGFAPNLPGELRQWTGIGSKGNYGQQDRMLDIVKTGKIKQSRDDAGRPFVPQTGQGYTPPAKYKYFDMGYQLTLHEEMNVLVAGGIVYQVPAEIVDIPVYTAGKLGINTDVIFNWWRCYGARGGRDAPKNNAPKNKVGEKTPRVRFKALSAWNNCAGTTALALKVGGATFFRTRSGRHWSTPRGVRDWAKGVAETANEMNRATSPPRRNEELLSRFQLKTFEAVIKNASDLPTLQEWKKISYVGVFARRSKQIDAIDNYLKMYHFYRWGAQNDGYKAFLLNQIIRQAENHAITKPNSDRMHAVAYLLAQGWKVLDKRLTELAAAANVVDPGNERDRYGSLVFSAEELQRVFLGDDWVVQAENGGREDALEFEERRNSEPRFSELSADSNWIENLKNNDQSEDGSSAGSVVL